MDETGSAIVVMGVAGCGKSSVAHAVAARLGARFVEGDAFHCAANVDKMRRGIGLVDADRWSWLDRLAAELKQAQERGERVVLACSALKRRYRDRLRGGCPTTAFVFLDLPPEEAVKRVGQRSGHFMPDSLVASQFADLEAPLAEARTLRVDATRPIDTIVEESLAWHARAWALAAGNGIAETSAAKDSAVFSAGAKQSVSQNHQTNSTF